MSDIVVRVDGLSKLYRIAHEGSRYSYRTVREDLADFPKRLWARFHGSRATPAAGTSDPSLNSQPPSSEDFYALKDLCFEVKQGQVVGIIGRNGAGKSTLLKILSRITEPTRGRVEVYGRVGSLLEVGTGFHPELTGRENIFLNGAILGMRRAEIRSCFDEIVAFAEVEQFLDTPVKRYSSGMYVRLAFAVAAHLEPEILIVDEVLAVGDAQFQAKCLGKMSEIAGQGRTVLLVSHQMGAVAQLCTDAILLKGGELALMGPTKTVIDCYLQAMSGTNAATFTANRSSAATDIAIMHAQALADDGAPCSRFTHKDAIVIRITCRVNRWVSGTELRLVIRDDRGRTVFTDDTELDMSTGDGADSIVAEATIPPHFLRPNTYVATLATFIPHQLIIDLVQDAFTFSVIDGGSKYAASEGTDYGCVFAECDWKLSYSSD